MSTITLRIVHVNDVYELGEFPGLASVYKEAAPGSDLCLLTLGGDFVGPSLLSGLDQGKGMIDVMNATGVTHVCFGNHEDDIPTSSLYERIAEFKGKWLNSNMPKFGVKLPEYDVVKVSSKDGSNTKSVAFLGLLCHYPSLYRTNAFGAGVIQSVIPVNDSLDEWNEKLKSQVDLIIPLTHQDLSDDRILAKKNIFPLILGAHDHDEYYEDKDGSILIKAGMDAHKAAIVDIVWESGADKPKITYSVKATKEFKPDPTVKALAEKHMAKLLALDAAVIYRHPKGELLSSREMRLHQTTMGRLVCTAYRDVLKVDAALVDAGNIRANRDYPEGKITLSDVRRELPFGSEMMILKMTGEDVRKILKFSREKEFQTENPGYLQADEGVKVDANHNVTHIRGAPIDLKKLYNVAYLQVSIGGMNNNTELIAWVKNHPESVPHADSIFPGKPLLLRWFSTALWKQLPPFEVLDVDKNGSLSIDEVKAGYAKAFNPDLDNDSSLSEVEKQALDYVVEKLVEALNVNGDNRIDRQEYFSGIGISSKKVSSPAWWQKIFKRS
eukprot:TRINITY_DN6996_c0_g1_i2.p1 TRINITY_DN6996_c0_g1~~TRINITY_DN6996_c0_g1_i2.p1  ORF type:complete len:554 (+),score=112.41 TRINITY_DN6996_c0_g1_i2:79-1740(+)